MDFFEPVVPAITALNLLGNMPLISHSVGGGVVADALFPVNTVNAPILFGNSSLNSVVFDLGKQKLLL
jgi:hypothetical protein